MGNVRINLCLIIRSRAGWWGESDMDEFKELPEIIYACGNVDELYIKKSKYDKLEKQNEELIEDLILSYKILKELQCHSKVDIIIYHFETKIQSIKSTLEKITQKPIEEILK